MYCFIITGTTGTLGFALFEEIHKLSQINEKFKNTLIISISRRLSDQLKKYEIYNNVRLLLYDLSNPTILAECSFSQLIPNIYKHIFFINNAFSSSIGFFDQLSPLEINNILNINIVSPSILFNHFLNCIKSDNSRCGHIINITSGANGQIYRGWSLYSISKNYIEKLLANIKKEDDTQQIEITNFDPGVFDSNMQKTLREAISFPMNVYFQDLHKNNNLKNHEQVANEIINTHIL